MKNTIAIIVSRSGSTRVPGKALIDLCGESLLAHMIRIAKQIIKIDSIWLATTNLSEDDELERIALMHKINVFRGDPVNVLNRIYDTSKKAKADTIVYIGGDCPLLDPIIVSEAVDYFNKNEFDYLNNYDPPTYPGGMDINIINFNSLEIANRFAIAPSQRIHAFSYLTFHPEKFKIKKYSLNEDYSTFHWAIDYYEDIELIKLIYEKLLKKDEIIKMNDVFEVIRNNGKINKIHSKLKKQKVEHAFFSSLGMMSDITFDIKFLADKALDNLKDSNLHGAEVLYSEIARISHKLSHLK